MTTIVPSAAMLVFKGNTVLLVKHGPDSGNITGIYGLPAGHVDRGETEKETAVRELEEETGLVTDIQSVREFPGNYFVGEINRKNNVKETFSWKVFLAQNASGNLHKTGETIPEWVDVNELSKLPLLPNVKKAIENARLKKPRFSIICALSENRVIGKDNRIPWHIKDDLMRFKDKTLHHTVIMGKTSFDSMYQYYKEHKRSLPSRNHIIITRDTAYKIDLPFCFVVPSLEKAFEKAREIEQQEVFISGGASIFDQTIDKVERLYLTIVHKTIDGDRFFPSYPQFLRVLGREDKESEGYSYTFLDLERV